MFCMECGNQLNSYDRVCPQCRAEVKNQTSEAEAIASNPQMKDQVQKEIAVATKKKTMRVILLFGGGVILASIGYLAYVSNYSADALYKKHLNTISLCSSSETKQCYEDSWKLAYLAAQKGNSDAQLYVGLQYYQVKDYEKAKNWLTLSASQGNGEAKAKLNEVDGYYYYAEMQKATKANDQEQVKVYFIKAIEAKHPEALCTAGELAREGKDFELAIFYFSEAAKRGSLLALHHLGYLYSDGLGVEKNVTKAVEFLTLASEGGFAPSMASLGAAYLAGMGVPLDLEKARYYAEKSAALGDERGKKVLALVKETTAKKYIRVLRCNLNIPTPGAAAHMVKVIMQAMADEGPMYAAAAIRSYSPYCSSLNNSNYVSREAVGNGTYIEVATQPKYIYWAVDHGVSATGVIEKTK